MSEGGELLREGFERSQRITEGSLRSQAAGTLGRHILALRHHLLEKILPEHAMGSHCVKGHHIGDFPKGHAPACSPHCSRRNQTRSAVYPKGRRLP